MKKLAFASVLFLSSTLFAQIPGGPGATPAAPASTPVAIPPETVVAEVDGKKYTAADVDQIVAGLPPQVQALFKRDPKQGLSYVLMYKYLAKEAEKAKLDQQSPQKEMLEYSRESMLSQAEINKVRNFDVKVEPDDEKKYYKEHPERFQDAQVRVIYVAFSNVQADGGAKRTLTESEAKVKIEGLKKQLAGGADFGKLARENSDDKESAAKDGDFGVIKRASPYPDSIKNAVFQLKPGQVSEPVREKNGFYLLRMESVTQQPYDQVRSQIFDLLKQQGFDTWFQATQKRYEVKVENPAYFTPSLAK